MRKSRKGDPYTKTTIREKRTRSFGYRSRLHGNESCLWSGIRHERNDSADPENIEANQVLVELIKTIATAKQATPAQIALAWVLTQKSWIVPIPGTRKLERLEENLGAANVVLSPKELSDLNDTLSKIELSGERYPEEYANLVGK